MPAGRIAQVSLWTDWQCNSGIAKGPIPVISGSLTERIDNRVAVRQVTIVTPLTWEQYGEVIVGRVIRLHYRDDATIPYTEDWVEYRITDLVEDVKAGTATLSGTDWMHDLVEKDSLVSVTVSGAVSFVDNDYAVTPSAALTSRVDGNLPAYWGLGTVTPTALIDVSYNLATPLAAAIAIADAAALADGGAYELSARRNGTTGLLLDLTVYGGGTVDVRTRKNVTDARRTKRRDQQTTRVAFSTDKALRRPTFQVSAFSAGASIDVTDLVSGAGPVQETDEWKNYYLVEWKNGTTHLITGSSKQSYGTSRFTVTSTTTIAVGDYLYLAADASSTDISYVDSPSLQTTWGKRLGVLSGTDYPSNLLRNADLRSGTSSTPTNWTINGTPVRDTTAGKFRYGGCAYRLDTNSALIERGETVQCAAGDIVTYTAYLMLSAYLVAASGGKLSFWDPNSGTQVDYALDGTVSGLDQLNTFLSFTRTFQVTAAGAKTLKVRFGHDTSTGNALYADAASITVNATPQSFRAGSGAATNIQTANAHFLTNGAPVVTYDIGLVDLTVIDPAGYGSDRPALGATCYLTESTLGESRTALRIVEQITDFQNPAEPKVVLSNLPKRLTTLLAS